MVHKLEELFKLEDMDKRVVEQIKSFNKEDLHMSAAGSGEKKYELMLDTISNDAVGRPAAENIADFFGINIEGMSDEEARRMIEDVEENFARELNGKVRVCGYNSGSFYFGNLENTEMHGLLFWWEEKYYHKAICLECDWKKVNTETTESTVGGGEVSLAFCQGEGHRQDAGHRLIYMVEDEIMSIDDLRDEEKKRLFEEDLILIGLVERAKKLGKISQKVKLEKFRNLEV